jgi:hypothetical protein
MYVKCLINPYIKQFWQTVILVKYFFSLYLVKFYVHE